MMILPDWESDFSPMTEPRSGIRTISLSICLEYPPNLLHFFPSSQHSRGSDSKSLYYYRFME